MPRSCAAVPGRLRAASTATTGRHDRPRFRRGCRRSQADDPRELAAGAGLADDACTDDVVLGRGDPAHRRGRIDVRGRRDDDGRAGRKPRDARFACRPDRRRRHGVVDADCGNPACERRGGTLVGDRAGESSAGRAVARACQERRRGSGSGCRCGGGEGRIDRFTQTLTRHGSWRDEAGEAVVSVVGGGGGLEPRRRLAPRPLLHLARRHVGHDAVRAGSGKDGRKPGGPGGTRRGLDARRLPGGPGTEDRTARKPRRQAELLLVAQRDLRRRALGIAAMARVGAVRTFVALLVERDEGTRERDVVRLPPFRHAAKIHRETWLAPGRNSDQTGWKTWKGRHGAGRRARPSP